MPYSKAKVESKCLSVLLDAITKNGFQWEDLDQKLAKTGYVLMVQGDTICGTTLSLLL